MDVSSSTVATMSTERSVYRLRTLDQEEEGDTVMYLFYLAGVVKNIGSLTISSETAGAMPSSLSNISPTAETLRGGPFLT